MRLNRRTLLSMLAAVPAVAVLAPQAAEAAPVMDDALQFCDGRCGGHWAGYVADHDPFVVTLGTTTLFEPLTVTGNSTLSGVVSGRNLFVGNVNHVTAAINEDFKLGVEEALLGTIRQALHDMELVA